MTKEQTKGLLDIINGAYGNFLMNREKNDVFNAWYEVLKNCDYELINKRVMQWILENKTPPTISDIYREDWRKKYDQPV